MFLTQIESFSYLIFWDEPAKTLAFIFLIGAFISLWIKRAPWFWGPLLALSYLFSYQAGIATLETLIPIGFLLVAHLILHGEVAGFSRFVVILVALILSFALNFHMVPGFSNWLIISKASLGTDAMPYTLYYNFDKPFIGFFILALNLPLIRDRITRNKMLFKTFMLGAIGIAIILYLSITFHVVKYDLKIPSFLPIWIFANLFLTSIPEEVFFRGFIQRELTEHMKFPLSSVLVVIIVALAFALAHLFFIQNPAYLVLAFTSGVVYGTIYQVTKKIESSILCHFFLNLVHIIFFTYPALTQVKS